MMYQEEFKSNKQLWNVWAKNHVASDFYDVDGFKSGDCALKEIELKALGESLEGKSLLHLQCHFGLDTLSWARRGARVTGVDFSQDAIRIAKELSLETGVGGRFIESDLYDLPNQLSETFDYVYTSYGVLGWLPDLNKWAALVNQYLEPGGTFYMVEFHPFFYVFEFSDQQITYPYFNHGAIKEENEGSYAHRGPEVKTTSYWWNHSLSEILSPLLKAGLQLESFDEYPYSVYNCFENTEEREPGHFYFKGLEHRVPMMFAIKMKKPH